MNIAILEDESIHIYRLTEIISSLLKDLGVSSYDLKTFKDKKALLAELAIMPSKYTDEIENSSYTWRVFYMSRKSKYSAEQKLAILNELTCNSISEVAKKYAVGKKTIEYFNTQRAYASKNDLTAEKFCLQTA